jgi:hypothetical protein
VIITGSGTAFMNNSTKQAASSFNTQTSEFIRRRSNELFGPLLYMLPNGQLISDSKGEEKAHQRVTPHKNGILHRAINAANHYEKDITAQGAITAFIT